MSRENVELVRDAVEAWNRADRSWLTYLAPDVELLRAGPAAVEQENVEVVRSVVEAFAERDEVTPFKHYAPDIEWEDRVAGVVAVHHGHGGVRAKFYDLLQAFREF